MLEFFTNTVVGAKYWNLLGGGEWAGQTHNCGAESTANCFLLTQSWPRALSPIGAQIGEWVLGAQIGEWGKHRGC